MQKKVSSRLIALIHGSHMISNINVMFSAKSTLLMSGFLEKIKVLNYRKSKKNNKNRSKYVKPNPSVSENKSNFNGTNLIMKTRGCGKETKHKSLFL